MNIIDLVAEAQSKLIAPGAPFELESKQIDGQSYQTYRNAPLNLSQVIRDARRNDEQCFLVYQGARSSYKTFFEQVDSLATWMQQNGIVKGDKVAIAMRNRPEWVVSFCATALIGAIPAPLNSFGMEPELLAALATVNPDLVICDSPRWQKINKSTSWPGRALVLGDNVITTPLVTDLQVALNHQAVELALPEISPEDPALVLFTSGATSVAKAVVSSHIAVCQALYNIDFIGALSALTSPEAVQRIIDKGCAPTTLTAVPLFHVSGLHAQLLSALRGGRRLVFMHKWQPSDAVKLIEQEQVTQFNGAPSMVMQLMREPGFLTPQVMKSFSGLGFGGAGLPTTLVDKVLTELSEQMIGIGFGMTETNGVGAAAAGDVFRHQAKSSGLVSPIMEMRVCALDGEVLAANEVGEICMRGISLMQGYVGNTSATKETIRDSWLHTGDLGYIDQDGFLFIVDRFKDVINRAGENISAAEVESSLLEHSDVAEAAVFGVSDEETGEAVVAVVSPLDDMPLDEETLQRHVAERLAKYKVPTKIFIMEQQLPRNPAGKLLRNKLKKMFCQ